MPLILLLLASIALSKFAPVDLFLRIFHAGLMPTHLFARLSGEGLVLRVTDLEFLLICAYIVILASVLPSGETITTQDMFQII